MTSPKSQHETGSPRKAGSPALNETINELEGLITDKASIPQDKTGNGGIPVLDEIIDVGGTDYIDDMEMLLNPEKLADDTSLPEHISPEQLEIIIGNVEEKLAGELDALVNILKDTIKDTIMTEIRTQIESGLNKARTAKPDDNPS